VAAPSEDLTAAVQSEGGAGAAFNSVFNIFYRLLKAVAQILQNKVLKYQ